MKKTIMLLSAAALLFAACQKEEGSIASINGLKLTATIEQQDSGSETKTYLEDLQVKWSTSDQVNVFTNATTPEKLTLTLSEGEETTSGIFTTSESYTGTPQYAIYPATDDNSINGSTITFTLPDTQNYVENSFDNGANVAVGAVSDGKVAYKNVCGVLKLKLKGDITVSKIVLSGKNSENLWGTFTINAANVTSAGATYSTGGGTTLTLNCGDDGVELSLGETTTFYFVVPVGAFGDDTYPGFTAKVYEKGTSSTYDVETNSANVISRSRIKAMPSCWLANGNVYVLPSTYQEVEYLESTGTQYINTGLIVTSNTLKVEVDFKMTSLTLGQVNGTYTGTTKATKYRFSEFGITADSCYFWIGMGYSQQLLGPANLNKHTINLDMVTGNYSLDGTNYNVPMSSKSTSGTPYLFGRNYGDECVSYCYEKIYHAIYYINGTAARYFIPCYDNSNGNKPGMYAFVSNTFFVNQGTGYDFIVGPKVD